MRGERARKSCTRILWFFFLFLSFPSTSSSYSVLHEGDSIHDARYPVPRQFSHRIVPFPAHTGQWLPPSRAPEERKSVSPIIIAPVPWHQRHSPSPLPAQHSQGARCVLPRF